MSLTAAKFCLLVLAFPLAGQDVPTAAPLSDVPVYAAALKAFRPGEAIRLNEATRADKLLFFMMGDRAKTGSLAPLDSSVVNAFVRDSSAAPLSLRPLVDSLSKTLGQTIVIVKPPTSPAPAVGQVETITFTRIAYSRDGTEALLEVSSFCGGRCGEGHLISLRKMNGAWVVVENRMVWIS